ncbi:MAG: sulfurtransferase TusA family protein [Desulfobacterales bacterium]
MENTVDARGLSCPQPVLITLEKIKKMSRGRIHVLVDTDTSRENVVRASENQGWLVENIQPKEDGYKITISKE